MCHPALTVHSQVKPWVWGKLVDAMGPNCYFVGEASNTCFDYVVSFINKGPGTPGEQRSGSR